MNIFTGPIFLTLILRSCITADKVVLLDTILVDWRGWTTNTGKYSGVPFSALPNRTLQIVILQSEKGRHGKPFATCSYQLNVFSRESTTCLPKDQIDTKSRIHLDLTESSLNQANCCPEICISIKYHSDTNRLNVIIYNVRNIMNGTKGIYVKVKLFKGLSCKDKQTKQTSIAKTDFIFNESFTFVKIFSLDFISLQITLMSQKTLFGMYDKPIGSIMLGSELFAKGKELSYWQQMVNQPDEHIVCWLPLRY